MKPILHMELIFSKLLTQTDIERRLSVPTCILYLFPYITTDHRCFDLQVKDTGDVVWSFRCIRRDGVYAKPVFSKGWLEFVYAKGLQAYDKIVVYKEKGVVEGDVPYRIEVKRKILRLMGEDIWIEIEHLHLYS
ncbi:hypothetical protein CXB51_002124 [Gossypium anomalum]|uniref:TF-B3 domain-containing protein n=1 Tax=Gossypium anomalum TaxID=47600 RepID=A0A8J6D846_9ROSI|nr:hypothetical protein CXB51_002124 [Gossypium anomalum]